jgi:membrane associated rhomboid family serine protease
MLFFWFFGSALAAHWSRREFLVFFFFCGIGAALCTLAYDMLLGRAIPSLGASGAIFGLMAAYAMIFGERMILLFMMIPIKARHLVGVLMAIEFLLVLGGTSDGIGHVAHLSGALCGAAYLFVVRRWRTRPAAAPDALQSRFSSLEIGSD